MVHAGSVCFGASEETGDPGRPLDPAGVIRLEVTSDVVWHDVHNGSSCTEWMADDCLLSPEDRDPRGLGFRWRIGNTSDDLAPPESEDFVAWGESVCGVVWYEPEMTAQWFYVQGRGFLPLVHGRKMVLVQERAFEVAPGGGGHGLRYQPTTSNHEDVVNELVPPGSVVVGFHCCGGEFVWVRDRGYFPLSTSGRQMLLPMFDPAGNSPSFHNGILTWMLFDDQERHWGAVRDRLDNSTNLEITHASSTLYRFPAPPWFFSKAYLHTTAVKEKFARHWHIVLSGANVLQDGPRSRYRVFVKSHLRSFGPSNLSPEKCPGTSPLVWLQRAAQQGYTSVVGD